MSDDGKTTHHVVNPDGSRGADLALKSALPVHRCPCGGTFEATTDGSILHSLPMCMALVALDTPEFLAWARKGGARPVQ